MRTIITLYIIFTGLLSVTAQEYTVFAIKPEIRKNADAVIRLDEKKIEIKSKTKLVENYKLVVTILNKRARALANLYEFYDKSSSINILKATVYDSLGLKSKEFHKSDFSDESRISNSTLFQDDRVKYIEISSLKYPYTIEFICSRETNSNFFIRGWSPIDRYNVSVEKSTYEITYPNSLQLRFKESKLAQAQKSSDADKTTVKYSCLNLPAFEHEEMSVGLDDITPWVLVGPTGFNYENTEGDLSSWSTLGLWVHQLSKDSDILPPAMVTKVHELTDNLNNPKEKAKVLYNYLQSKTRYINVSLGIGGFKPFPAEKVATNNYGDCKALSNYMKALLKEAGIKSQLVVIKAGDNEDIFSDFSSMGQANHMILCAPISTKDTLWFECTSQRSPFNYLGSFTEGRNAILVSEAGGKVVQTPKMMHQQNFLNRRVLVKLDATGDAVCNIKTTYGGEQFERMQEQLFIETIKQKENLYNGLQIPNKEIVNFSYLQPEEDLPELSENIELKTPKLINGLGNNFFLTLNLMNKRSYALIPQDNRKTKFSVENGYYDKDEIIYEIPDNYVISFLPANQELKTEFGIYKIEIKQDKNKVIYTREQIMYENVYPPEKYSELLNFYKSINKADKQKAILNFK